MAKAKGSSFPLYRGKALVRSGNTIYYGNPTDPFVAMLQIVSSHDFKENKISDKVMVQILATDESLPMQERLVKRTEKNGLYSALAIACIWLERLEEEKKA